MKGPSGDDIVLDFSWSEWDETRHEYVWKRGDAFIDGRTRFRAPGQPGILKVRFVDIRQGDAAIIETGKGRLMIVDGGEDAHLRNYVT